MDNGAMMGCPKRIEIDRKEKEREGERERRARRLGIQG
jgi:hypothetical protein